MLDTWNPSPAFRTIAHPGQLLGAAESILNAIDGEWWPADRVEIDRAQAQLKADSAVGFSSRWKEGELMTLAEAIDYAAAGWEAG